MVKACVALWRLRLHCLCSFHTIFSVLKQLRGEWELDIGSWWLLGSCATNS